jgi:hypothetical protein
MDVGDVCFITVDEHAQRLAAGSRITPYGRAFFMKAALFYAFLRRAAQSQSRP